MRRRGFTLIELLVVVAIIAILAAIALPNFLEAQTRSKVARVKNDQRTLATALEAYYVDNNSYLPAPVLLGPRFYRLIPLTSPISYISEIPLDPFESIDSNGPRRFRTGIYDYGAELREPAAKYIIASDGPDRNDSTPGSRIYPGYEPGLFVGQVPDHPYMTYDPTNGTISRGDIIRASDYAFP